MQMTLSGWQRIGIVISVIWVMSISGVTTFEMLKGAPFGEFVFVDLAPDSSRQATTLVDPYDGKTHTYRPVRPVIKLGYTLTTAFVPILTGWLLVYLIAWTVRWVRKGFQGQKRRTD
jgi:hypothetical protein